MLRVQKRKAARNDSDRPCFLANNLALFCFASRTPLGFRRIRFGLRFALALLRRCAFGCWHCEAVTQNMQAEEMGRAGFGARSGDDTKDVLRARISALFEELLCH